MTHGAASAPLFSLLDGLLGALEFLGAMGGSRVKGRASGSGWSPANIPAAASPRSTPSTTNHDDYESSCLDSGRPRCEAKCLADAPSRSGSFSSPLSSLPPLSSLLLSYPDNFRLDTIFLLSSTK